MEIKITEHKDLTPFTTFGVPASARWYAEYASEEELLRISRTDTFINNEVLHIGGGSNLLFMHEFNGLVLRSRIMGITRYEKDPEHVFAIAGAGESWDAFVDWCVREGLGGVENMAGIPGDVGASAVQNVGAYGMEAGDVIHSVECFDTFTRHTRRFTREECRFAYRDSFFKHEGRGRYVVLRVAFRLRPSAKASCLTYGSLQDLATTLGHKPSIAEVAAEVRKIRNLKLPDPAITGSAGSFFKNPVIGKHHYTELCSALGVELPAHSVGEHGKKLSAAWLIDHAGMKGARHGNAVVWEKQPLVIANEGGATARDVAALAEDVRKAVRRKFNINLQPEVNYIDTRICVTVLGSGTSKGVPEVACDCRTCTSGDPHDKRMRASVLVRTHGMNILIDPSADFRQQALAGHIYDIDAVLITHSHYDHVGGIDDLRPFCLTGSLPLYVRKDVDVDLRRRLDYCFSDHLYPGVPTFNMHVIDNMPFFINGLKIVPVEVMHGKKPIYGYRIGAFGYVTDAKSIDEWEKEKLRDLDVLIVNALRYTEHFAHFSIDEALELIRELKPKRAYLTHMSHEAGLHAELAAHLPEGVAPAYDGMTFTVE